MELDIESSVNTLKVLLEALDSINEALQRKGNELELWRIYDDVQIKLKLNHVEDLKLRRMVFIPFKKDTSTDWYTKAMIVATTQIDTLRDSHIKELIEYLITTHHIK